MRPRSENKRLKFPPTLERLRRKFEMKILFECVESRKLNENKSGREKNCAEKIFFLFSYYLSHLRQLYWKLGKLL